jgi:DNA-binding LytR/AlgR family response regulator
MNQLRQPLTSQVACASALTLLVNRHFEYVPFSQIIRAEMIGPNKAAIYVQGGKQYTTAKCMTVLQSIMPTFWRVRSNHLVNPSYVYRSPNAVRLEGELKLTTGESLPVGRKWKQDLITKLLNWP